MSLTKATFSMLSGAPFNILDYGAVGDGSTNDTAAIQAAIDAASSAGGGCVYIPSGTFKTTSTLTVPSGVSIKGYSAESSIIRPTSCDGITMLASNGIGPIVFEDFWIYGDTTSTNIGIKFVGDANTATRVTGLNLNRLRIQNFRDGINFRSVRSSSIKNCVLYLNIFGIVIRGQCISIDIENNGLTHNLLGSTTPTATGIVVKSTFDYDPGASTEKRPEDIRIVSNYIASFPLGVDLSNGLFLNVTNNDIDLITSTGVKVTSIGGTLNINDNWIGLVGSSPLYGIWFDALGSVGNIAKNVVGNEINSVNLSTASGVYVYTNQNSVTISQNSISNFTTDILLQNCSDITVSDNLCRTSGQDNIYVIGSQSGKTISINDNSCAGRITLNPTSNSSQIVLGQNNGLNSTYIRGKSTIAAGTTTVTTTYASLSSAPPDFGAAGTVYIVPKLFTQTPSVNIGAVWGTATASQVTINCASAPVADQTIYWEVKGFASVL